MEPSANSIDFDVMFKLPSKPNNGTVLRGKDNFALVEKTEINHAGALPVAIGKLRFYRIAVVFAERTEWTLNAFLEVSRRMGFLYTP